GRAEAKLDATIITINVMDSVRCILHNEQQYLSVCINALMSLVLVSMSEDKTEGREVASSVNLEERPNLEDYKSKDKASGSASNTTKTTDFDSVTTVPTPEGDVEVETKLEIPVEDNKEDVKSEAKSPKVKKSSEVEEPSITTVSKEELTQRSNEVQQNRSTAS
ncbi:MAG TPA: hypothetical protein VJ250_05655, partial [Nitrososphaeraceae archaeon]|nr:hypothetical protein [Nitrososphaeraceae archaeon]